MDTPTLSQFAEKFLRLSRAFNRPSEVISKESIIRCHLKPAFQRITLDEIDYAAVQDYATLKLKTLSKKTVNNHLTVLRRILVVAQRRKLIALIPEIEWLKPPPPPFDFLSFEEGRRLIGACVEQPRDQHLITTAMKTGLRMGELLALGPRDVDLHAGRLRVWRAFVKGSVVPPKSGRERMVPLSDQARRALAAQLGALDTGAERAFPLTPGKMRCLLYRACDRAELRRIGWHVLRHTFASHLVMRGAPIKAVQEMLGYATMEMTLRYAHLSPEVPRDAVKLLDA